MLPKAPVTFWEPPESCRSTANRRRCWSSTRHCRAHCHSGVSSSSTAPRICASCRLDQLDTLFAAIKAGFGRIDVLFVNAGGGSLSALGDITEEHFDDTFGRNVKGVVFTVQKALPLLADGASVILNGSTSSAKATPGFSIYSASKAAVHAFTRNWMVELSARHIRINTLVPGPTGTPGLRGLAGEDAGRQKALLDQFALGVPLGRVGDPTEIARAALFLASDDASFVTGSELFVDGGEGHS